DHLQVEPGVSNRSKLPDPIDYFTRSPRQTVRPQFSDVVANGRRTPGDLGIVAADAHNLSTRVHEVASGRDDAHPIERSLDVIERCEWHVVLGGVPRRKRGGPLGAASADDDGHSFSGRWAERERVDEGVVLAGERELLPRPLVQQAI